MDETAACTLMVLLGLVPLLLVLPEGEWSPIDEARTSCMAVVDGGWWVVVVVVVGGGWWWMVGGGWLWFCQRKNGCPLVKQGHPAWQQLMAVDD